MRDQEHRDIVDNSNELAKAETELAMFDVLHSL